MDQAVSQGLQAQGDNGGGGACTAAKQSDFASLSWIKKIHDENAIIYIYVCVCVLLCINFVSYVSWIYHNVCVSESPMCLIDYRKHNTFIAYLLCNFIFSVNRSKERKRDTWTLFYELKVIFNIKTSICYQEDADTNTGKNNSS